MSPALFNTRAAPSFRSSVLTLLSSLVLLGACAEQRVTGPAYRDDDPVAWFYADMGDGMDWSSVATTRGVVSFVPTGGDLGSAPLAAGPAIAADLRCGAATRLVVRLVEGEVEEVSSFPRSVCAEVAAARRDWRDTELGALLAEDTTHALLVVDVPGAATASVSR